MDVNKNCIRALEERKMFENGEHSSRFSELVTCYGGYPFYTKGICKCMYLSSWDMDHFLIILDILNDMTIEHCQDTEQMKDNGKVLENRVEGYEKYVMQLSHAFLNDEEYTLPDVEIEEEGLYIIRRAVEAAKIIDEVFAQE